LKINFRIWDNISSNGESEREGEVRYPFCPFGPVWVWVWSFLYFGIVEGHFTKAATYGSNPHQKNTTTTIPALKSYPYPYVAFPAVIYFFFIKNRTSQCSPSYKNYFAVSNESSFYRWAVIPFSDLIIFARNIFPGNPIDWFDNPSYLFLNHESNNWINKKRETRLD